VRPLTEAERAAILVPRCKACAGTDCPGITGGIDVCPAWQEAEARNARGEYLQTTPIRVAADVVTCCLCDKQWPEDDDGVWWRGQDAYCTDYDACTTRQIEQEQKDHR
jgi:hypothetical protein